MDALVNACQWAHYNCTRCYTCILVDILCDLSPGSVCPALEVTGITICSVLIKNVNDLDVEFASTLLD